MATRRSKTRKKKSGGFSGFLLRLFKWTFVFVCIGGAVAGGFFGAKLWGQLQDLPDVTLVERYEPIEAIQLFDRNDRMICTVEGDEDRRVVPLNQVSTQMQQAILAAEDHHFYEHKGVNFMSIGRATLANLQAGHVVEGASTITQQLVKNLFFPEAGRTFDRKIKEAYMAWQIEERYPKERILEMYLNQVYFGNTAYGIERAASRYFDKTAARLTLAESAFLAGLVKAPSELGAAEGRNRAKVRQKEILDKMIEYGYITDKQADVAKKQKLAFKKGSNPLQKYPYYVSYVLEILRDRFSQSELRRQGLKVYTNLDPVAQELAEKALAAGISKAPKGVSQGAMVSVLVQDGSVISMVGGVGDFWKNQFNRATNPHSAGSSFKPFVYLSAFVKGVLTPDSLIEDTPLIIKQPYGLPDYAPKNFDRKFMGKITVRRALALSRNIPSVRTTQLTGVDNIVETARMAGISTKLDANLSLALGSSAVSPLDMAGAYATFARAGVFIKPQVLRKIENNRGAVIEIFEPKVDRAFPVEPVARLVDVMQDVVKYGTGAGAKLEERPVAGKTGTADEGRDIWFIGFTPDLVTACWGGNDEHLAIPGQNVTGGVIMAKIWKEFNKAYYATHPTPPGMFIPPNLDIDKDKPKKEENKDEQIAGSTPDPLPNPDANDVPMRTTGTRDDQKPQDSSGSGPDAAAKTEPQPAPDLTPTPSVTPQPAPAPTIAPAPSATPSPETGTPAVAPTPGFLSSPQPRRFGPYTPQPAFSPGPSDGRNRDVDDD